MSYQNYLRETVVTLSRQLHSLQTGYKEEITEVKKSIATITKEKENSKPRAQKIRDKISELRKHMKDIEICNKTLNRVNEDNIALLQRVNQLETVCEQLRTEKELLEESYNDIKPVLQKAVKNIDDIKKKIQII